MRRFKGVFIAFFIAMLFSFTNVSAYKVDVGNGNDAGGIIPGASNGWKWFATNSNKTAWKAANEEPWRTIRNANTFPLLKDNVSNSGASFKNLEQYINWIKPGMASASCKPSQRIYIYVTETSKSGGPFIPKTVEPRAKTQNAFPTDAISRAIKSKAKADMNKGNAVVVCSYDMEKKVLTTKIEGRWVNEESINITNALHSTELKVTGLRKGQTFERIIPAKTGFGTAYDSTKVTNALASLKQANKNNDASKVASYIKIIKDELNGKSQTAANIKLNSSNLGSTVMGFIADGGVFNVVESERRINISMGTQYKETRTLTYEAIEIGGVSLGAPKLKSTSAWTKTGEKRIITALNHKDTSLVPQSHYQLLTVKCNVDDFKKEISGKSINKKSESSTYSWATTKKTSVSTALPFNNLAKKEAFFTDGKSCDVFTCVPANLSGLTSGDLAKTGSGANQVNTPVGKASKGFEFFRDNEARTITLNRWVAQFKSGMQGDYGSIKEVSTQVNLKEGTPSLANHAELVASGGTKLKNGVNNISGMVNSLTAKSEWASDKGSPHKITTSWKYSSSFSSTMPNSFDKNGHLTTTTTSGTNYPICAAGVATPNVVKSAGAWDHSSTQTSNRSWFDVIFNRSSAN